MTAPLSEDFVLHLDMVLSAWATPDGYGVDMVPADTARDLVRALVGGTSPLLLAQHAEHIAADCWDSRCASRLPAYIMSA